MNSISVQEKLQNQEALKEASLALGDDGTEVRLHQNGDQYTLLVEQGGEAKKIALTADQFEKLWRSTLPIEDLALEDEPVSVEIERKFLVKHWPGDLDSYRSKKIIQGYVAIEKGGVEVRVRQKGEGKYMFTIKGGASDDGKKRPENEIEITEEQFGTLWDTTEGSQVEKVRYVVPLEGQRLEAELDIYKNRLDGLETVEVEFPNDAASEAFVPPAWFGQDVTSEKGLKNKELARNGVPEKFIEVVETRKRMRAQLES